MAARRRTMLDSYPFHQSVRCRAYATAGCIVGAAWRARCRNTKPSRHVRLLDEVGSPEQVATNAGRYFRVVNVLPPVCVATQWLATAWDQERALA